MDHITIDAFSLYRELKKIVKANKKFLTLSIYPPEEDEETNLACLWLSAADEEDLKLSCSVDYEPIDEIIPPSFD